MQRTVELREFRIGEVNRADSVCNSVGGKATNSARVLKRLGMRHLLLSFAGGYIGALIRHLLDAEDISCSLVETASESRICQTILDGRLHDFTEVIEDAAVPADAEWELFLSRFAEIEAAYDYIILSGTLRPSMPVDIYARLIALTDSSKILLDTSGEPLLAALEQRPGLVKINSAEVALTLAKEGDIAEMAGDLLRLGAGAVGITCGGDEAFLFSGDMSLTYRIPQVNIVSTLGCGDSVNAGVAAALGQGRSLPDAFAYGLACGTANALSSLPGDIDPVEVERLLAEYKEIN